MNNILKKIRKERVNSLVQELNRLGAIMLAEGKVDEETYAFMVVENARLRTYLDD